MSDTLDVPVEDFLSMLKAMEVDDTLHWCETCGAWLEIDHPALARTEDFTGCWKIATGGATKYNHLCASHRGALIEEAKLTAR